MNPVKSENGILDDPKDFVEWKWWVRSLYWVVTVVSTTGFGVIIYIFYINW